jgi:DNA transformation protein
MRVSSGFREFVLGQLADIHDLYAKPMFGGIGLYSGDVFFGIVAGDVLYFKVDQTTRDDYEQAGCRPFKPYADRPVTMQYYSVPAAAVEDAVALAQWAKRSIAVARARGKVESKK